MCALFIALRRLHVADWIRRGSSIGVSFLLVRSLGRSAVLADQRRRPVYKQEIIPDVAAFVDGSNETLQHPALNRIIAALRLPSCSLDKRAEARSIHDLTLIRPLSADIASVSCTLGGQETILALLLGILAVERGVVSVAAGSSLVDAVISRARSYLNANEISQLARVWWLARGRTAALAQRVLVSVAELLARMDARERRRWHPSTMNIALEALVASGVRGPEVLAVVSLAADETLARVSQPPQARAAEQKAFRAEQEACQAGGLALAELIIEQRAAETAAPTLPPSSSGTTDAAVDGGGGALQHEDPHRRDAAVSLSDAKSSFVAPLSLEQMSRALQGVGDDQQRAYSLAPRLARLQRLCMAATLLGLPRGHGIYTLLANSAYTAALPPQLQGTKVVKSMTSTGPSSLNGLSTVRVSTAAGASPSISISSIVGAAWTLAYTWGGSAPVRVMEALADAFLRLPPVAPEHDGTARRRRWTGGGTVTAEDITNQGPSQSSDMKAPDPLPCIQTVSTEDLLCLWWAFLTVSKGRRSGSPVAADLLAALACEFLRRLTLRLDVSASSAVSTATDCRATVVTVDDVARIAWCLGISARVGGLAPPAGMFQTIQAIMLREIDGDPVPSVASFDISSNSTFIANGGTSSAASLQAPITGSLRQPLPAMCLAVCLAGLANADAGAYELFRAVGDRISAASQGTSFHRSTSLNSDVLAFAQPHPLHHAKALAQHRHTASNEGRRSQRPDFHVGGWTLQEVSLLLHAFAAAGVTHIGLFAAVVNSFAPSAWIPQPGLSPRVSDASLLTAPSITSVIDALGIDHVPPTQATLPLHQPLVAEAVQVLHAFALTGALHRHSVWVAALLSSVIQCPVPQLRRDLQLHQLMDLARAVTAARCHDTWVTRSEYMSNTGSLGEDQSHSKPRTGSSGPRHKAERMLRSLPGALKEVLLRSLCTLVRESRRRAAAHYSALAEALDIPHHDVGTYHRPAALSQGASGGPLSLRSPDLRVCLRPPMPIEVGVDLALRWHAPAAAAGAVDGANVALLLHDSSGSAWQWRPLPPPCSGAPLSSAARGLLERPRPWPPGAEEAGPAGGLAPFLHALGPFGPTPHCHAPAAEVVPGAPLAGKPREGGARPEAEAEEVPALHAGAPAPRTYNLGVRLVHDCLAAKGWRVVHAFAEDLQAVLRSAEATEGGSSAGRAAATRAWLGRLLREQAGADLEWAVEPPAGEGGP